MPLGTGGKTGLVRVGQVGSGEIALQAEPEVCEMGDWGRNWGAARLVGQMGTGPSVAWGP